MKNKTEIQNDYKIDYDNLPDHVAIIMDGNGRWAQSRGLPRLAGHNAGVKALKNVAERASDIGLKYMTVYAFSTENWKRPTDEVFGIFKLVSFYVDRELKTMMERNTKLNILGDYTQLPTAAVRSIDKALRETAGNTALQLNIALNYGSRKEIADAVKSICMSVESGELKQEDVTEDLISSRLYTSDIPDPDLLIRTSGEMRISNYLLWQLAYSEFLFTDTYWPDFSGDTLEACIAEFQNRSRRYGGI